MNNSDKNGFDYAGVLRHVPKREDSYERWGIWAWWQHDELLTALTTMAEVQAGRLAVVPVEPTAEMLKAGFSEFIKTYTNPDDMITRTYKAMLSAAGMVSGLTQNENLLKNPEKFNTEGQKAD